MKTEENTTQGSNHGWLHPWTHPAFGVKHSVLGYLDTWSGIEAAKTAPWPSLGPTTLVNSMSPQMSELVEDASAYWCDVKVGQFGLIRNELQKLVEHKFEFFSFNIFDVSQIFWQRVAQPRPKYSFCILLKGLCWITRCVPCCGCSMGPELRLHTWAAAAARVCQTLVEEDGNSLNRHWLESELTMYSILSPATRRRWHNDKKLGSGHSLATEYTWRSRRWSWHSAADPHTTEQYSRIGWTNEK